MIDKTPDERKRLWLEAVSEADRIASEYVPAICNCTHCRPSAHINKDLAKLARKHPNPFVSDFLVWAAWKELNREVEP